MPPGATPTGRRWSWAALRRSGRRDRIRWAVVMAGALDPLRADLRPEAVTRTARRLTASMVDVLAATSPWATGWHGRGDRPGDRAWRGMTDQPLVLDDGRSPTGSIAERLALGAGPDADRSSWSGRSTRPWC